MKKLVLAAIALTASWCGTAQASTVTVYPEYVLTWDADFNILPIDIVANPELNQPGYTHAFAVRVVLNDAEVGEDLGAVGFNIDLGPGVTPVDFDSGFWNPVTGSYDNNGGLPGGVSGHFANNRDEANDLQNVFVEISNVVANQRQYGEPNRLQGKQPDNFSDPISGLTNQPNLGDATMLGAFFLNWDGTSPSSVGVSPNSPGGSSWSVFLNNQAGDAPGVPRFGEYTGGTIALGAPTGGDTYAASYSTGLNGTADVVIDGNTQQTGLNLTGPTTFHITNNTEFSGNLRLFLELGSLDGIADLLSELDGLVGSNPGDLASATQIDGSPFLPGANLLLTFVGGADGGPVTVDLELGSNTVVGAAVPEPSTFALAAMALVGLAGFRSRRRG